MKLLFIYFFFVLSFGAIYANANAANTNTNINAANSNNSNKAIKKQSKNQTQAKNQAQEDQDFVKIPKSFFQNFYLTNLKAQATGLFFLDSVIPLGLSAIFFNQFTWYKVLAPLTSIIGIVYGTTATLFGAFRNFENSYSRSEVEFFNRTQPLYTFLLISGSITAALSFLFNIIYKIIYVEQVKKRGIKKLSSLSYTNNYSPLSFRF